MATGTIKAEQDLSSYLTRTGGDNIKGSTMAIPTSATGTSSTTSLSYRRVGNFVQIMHAGIWNKTKNTSSAICTIPSGYRPSGAYYGGAPLVVPGAIVGMARIYIQINGSLSVISDYTGNAEYYFSFTYYCTETYPS